MRLLHGVLCHLIIVYLMVGCSGNRAPMFPGSPHDWDQSSVPERRLVSLHLDRIGTIPQDTSIFLTRPEVYRTDMKGNVLVLDFRNLMIRRFDANGQWLNSYGSGRGNAPGEFTGTVDFTVTHNGQVAVLEANERRLTWFDLSGRLRETVLHKGGSASRFIQTPLGRQYFLDLHNDSLLATVWNGVRTDFGSPVVDVNDPIANMFVKEGNLGVAGEDVIYVPARVPAIFRFAHDGSLVYSVTTPDRHHYSSVEIDESPFANGYSVRPATPYLHSLISVSDGNLYLLSRMRPRTVDVYEANTGAYRYSFDAPNESAHLHISGHRYIQREQDTLVAVYEMTLGVDD